MAHIPHLQTTQLFRRSGSRGLPSRFILIVRHLLPFIFCGVIILLHLSFFSPQKLERVENFFLDSFFRIRPTLKTVDNIVYIEISEDSLRAFGRWPWPREIHAVMTHVLTEWKAKAIFFDVVFSEASTPYDDGAFKEALEKAAASSTKVYLPAVLEKWGKEYFWIRCLPEFEQYATGGLGHMRIIPDQDGLVRRIRPQMSYGNLSLPHIGLKVAFDLLKEKGISFDQSQLPLDEKGNFMINWAGRWATTFKHVSYVDVIKSFESIKEGRPAIVSPSEIKDKICIIGVTATGLMDIKAAPIESVYPAVGVHGNVINSVLTHQFVRPVSAKGNTLSLIILGIVATGCFLPFRNVRTFIFAAGLILLWGLISFGVFWMKGIWLYMFQQILLIFILFLFVAMYSFFFIAKERTEFFELATHDGLTGLFLIRYFRQLLNQAVVETIHNKQDLALILMDIDNFKQCNDTYGHQMGDEVLKTVAKIVGSCQQALGEESLARCVSARYGGEEMVVMIKNSEGVETAVKVAEWIRQKVEKTSVVFGGLTISVTLSLGVSKLFEGETIPDIMIHRADEALYQSKNSGKNRVTVYDSKSTEM